MLASQIDLAGLPSAEGAAFDSHLDELDSRCHSGTRADLLRQIREWAEDPQGKCIFWLSGMAGTGKSTISRTVAQSFAEDGQLGASFFFKRGGGDRGNATKFFTTIATQLMLQVPGLIPYVRNEIEADPEISKKAMKEQFNKLIFQPLSEKTLLARVSKSVIVVDALDECEGEEDIKHTLYLLAQLQHLTTVRMRIFLTSRPELAVRLGFKEISADAHQDVVLQDLPLATITRDIFVYLKDVLARIQDEYNRSNPDCPLSPDWPGDDNAHALARIATPSFVFAAAACRFVGEKRGWNPDARLAALLECQSARLAFQMDQTYLPVLQQLLVERTDSEKEQFSREFQEIIGSIVILADPLPISPLARLLDVPKEEVDNNLHLLHSVLSIPTNQELSVRLLHFSFREFLLDPEKRGKSPFWVDERERHEAIATKCLDLMSQPGCLREDICHLESPGRLRSEINSQTIDRCLPADVQYACQYWVYHLEKSGKRIHDGDAVCVFLQENFLYWLEALSLIGKISESIALISNLQSLVQVSSCPGFHALVHPFLC
jgi:NACHT domain